MYQHHGYERDAERSYPSMISFDDHTHSTSLGQYTPQTYPYRKTADLSNPSYHNESASSILHTVKEQEAQFERLTRELEAERQSVADQLEQYRIGSHSQPGSVKNLNSYPNGESNGYSSTVHRYPQSDGWSEGDGRASPSSDAFEAQANSTGEFQPSGGANLMDSCVRELEEQGINMQTAYGKALTNGSEAGDYYNPYQNGHASYQQRLEGSRTPSERSTQNSYREPYGNGMIRSDASYDIKGNSASNPTYPANHQEYEDYRQPPTVPRHHSQISEGEYISGSAAASIINGYHDDEPNQQNGRQNGGYDPSEPASYGNTAGHRNAYPEIDRPHNHVPDNGKPDSHPDGSGSRGYPGYPYTNPSSARDLADGRQRPLSRGDRHVSRPDYIYDTIPADRAGSRPDLYQSRQSLHSRPGSAGAGKRPPELAEVIEYLRHPSDLVRSNAAAYLQHISYGNNVVKEQTRQLRGIPALVNLLSSDVPEVHRNALGALLNLSRGYENDDNKRAIKSCGGIEALSSLLGSSRDNDARELSTGLLWNLSSLAELKRTVIEAAVPALVRHVIYPSSGLPHGDPVTWSTEFRNATGVLRNVSSAGADARAALRRADGLVDSLIAVSRSVMHKAEMDNKPVENILCTLRNLSFRLMEVDYPDHYSKSARDVTDSGGRVTRQQSLVKEVVPTCFGKSKREVPVTTEYPVRTRPGSRRGEQLWQMDMADIYLPLLNDCSNTDTLEAAVGAIQNITACEWEPSAQFREQVRRRKGLPIIVELLGLEEADAVVCAAAIALRNLAVDRSNRTLIGKYATSQLVMKLPLHAAVSGTLERASAASEETIRAVLATLLEVFKHKDTDSSEHASTLVRHSDGLDRLMAITKSRKKYTFKTLKAAHQLLVCLWRFSSLRDVYKSKGFKEADFLSKSMHPRATENTGTMSLSSTLTRSRADIPSNTNTINRSGVTAAHEPQRRDEGERVGGGTGLRDGHMSSYPSNGTLPIQRPYYQPSDDPYLTQYPTADDKQGARADYQAEVYPSYPLDNHSASNPALSASRQALSTSRQALVETAGGGDAGYQHEGGEPLYARVDKRRTQSIGADDLSFVNPGYISGNGLNVSRHSLHDHPPPEVDSWV